MTYASAWEPKWSASRSAKNAASAAKATTSDAKDKAKESEIDVKKALSTIPEATRELPAAKISANVNLAGKSESYPAGHAKTLPLLHYLNQAWYLVPAGKENTRPLSADSDKGSSTLVPGALTDAAHEAAKALGISGAVSPPTAHVLGTDPALPVATASSPHLLNTDSLKMPQARSSKFTEHLLEDDPASMSTTPTIEVTQHLDTESTAAPAKGIPIPDTTQDLAASARFDAGGLHGLEDDSPVPVGTWRTKHLLDAHETHVSATGHLSHGLDEDPATPGSGGSRAKHTLEAHEEVSAGSKTGSSHRLEEH